MVGLFHSEPDPRAKGIAQRMYDAKVEDFCANIGMYRELAQCLAECVVDYSVASLMDEHPGNTKASWLIEHMFGQDPHEFVKKAVYSPQQMDDLVTRVFNQVFPAVDTDRGEEATKHAKTLPYFQQIARSGIPLDEISLTTDYDFSIQHYGTVDRALQGTLRNIASFLKIHKTKLTPEYLDRIHSTQYWKQKEQRFKEAYQRVMGKP